MILGSTWRTEEMARDSLGVRMKENYENRSKDSLYSENN